MFKRIPCVSLLVIVCFLAVPLSFGTLWAQEGMIKATVKPKPVEEDTQEQPLGENQPRISFDSITHDAGEVWEGDTVTHTFKVKNTGTAELKIKNVKPG